MECCTPQCRAMKMIVIGALLVLVRLYTEWDIWVVLGTLAIIKGVTLLVMPTCPCTKNKKR